MAATNKSLGHPCPFRAPLAGRLSGTLLVRFGGRVVQQTASVCPCLRLHPGLGRNQDQHYRTAVKQQRFVFFASVLVPRSLKPRRRSFASNKLFTPPSHLIFFTLLFIPYFFFFPLLHLLLCFADLDTPVLTVHQTISDVRGSYYQEKTVFLRCTVNSNPPARFIWKRGNMLIEQSKDNGVDIYEPLYTQVRRDAGTAPLSCWSVLLGSHSVTQ